MGSDILPDVLFALADVLHQFDEEGLESQLQTFDSFLDILSPAVRPGMVEMFQQASIKTRNVACKLRLEKAAQSVASGGRAAAPYDHDAAMKKYTEDHNKSFPPKPGE